LYGVKDLSASCGDENGPVMPLVGMPIWYYQCDHCQLIFTRNMDDWTIADFKDYIYNGSYHKVDPDYLLERPLRNAVFLHQLLDNTSLSLLDYGGGNGKTAEFLREAGYDAQSWDPFNGDPRPSVKVDVVSSIEVFEHTTDPHGTFQEATSFLKPGGMLVFTTLVNDDLKPREMHWYISPRNGHLLMHSYKSIQYLCDYYGWEVNHINNSLHTARCKK
jgi:2-polyprenyl-6-hydroxyphenyl methylase/3-demethylubiquinone-9 3-methyltransferase